MSGPPATGIARLAERAAGVEWFHSIDLGGGVITRGIDDSPAKLATLGMPEDLAGRTVLDIGAWDGYFSFEAERRGAERVVAVDSFVWGLAGGRGKDGFELARSALGSRVEDREMDVVDLSAEDPGVFDLVLCLGVLYHMRHPLLALERVAAVTRELCILETHVDLFGLRRPAAAFYGGQELDWDQTNWWGPNVAGLEAMLLAAGFREVEVVSRNSLPYRFARAARRLVRDGRVAARQGRVVVHARK